jgi:diguanylate cyclase (GGDEF)-like protein/PAS domain S-box-containing protein
MSGLDLYRRLLDDSGDPIFCFDLDCRYLYANQAFANGIGRNLEEVIGKTIWDVFPEDEAAKRFVHIKWVLDHKESKGFELVVSPPDGVRCYLTTLKPILDDQGRVSAVLANSKDISAYKGVEVKLRESEQRLVTAQEGAHVGVWEWNIVARRSYWSPECERIYGMKPGSLTSNDDWRVRVHPEDLVQIDAQWEERIEKHQSFEVDFRFRMDSGETRWLVTKGHAQYNAAGDPVSLSGVNYDITERKQLEDQVRQLAFHDTLTQLPNRRLLVDRLSQTMSASRRSGKYGALMMLDLDNFKPLNDAHGHLAGDLLLNEVARRLIECVRETDTIARVGGDEFVVLLGELDTDKTESTKQAGEVAEKIRASLALPYQLTLSEEGKADIVVQHRCSASIGVALLLNHEASQADILKWADTAMYRAKEAGRNVVRFYGLPQ